MTKNPVTRRVKELVVFLAVGAAMSVDGGVARAGEQLAKVGNSHAVWTDTGQVHLVQDGNPVVENIEISDVELGFEGKTVGASEQVIRWKAADGFGQELTVHSAGATLQWTPGSKRRSICVYIPERAFGGTAAWHYRLTDQTGKTVSDRLSSDWNFPEATKTNVAEMEIDTPAGSFTFICEGAGWRFVDTRPTKQRRGLFQFTVDASETVSFTVLYGPGRPARFRTIDISSACNMALRDDAPGDQKGGWDDEGPKDLRRLPAGLNYYAGIPFRVIDDDNGKKNACIVLAGRQRPYFPTLKRVGLSGKAKMFYFLNALTWGGYFDKPPFERARYVVEYQDGSQATFELRNGQQIGDWYEPKVLPAALPGWFDPMHASGASEVGLYVTYWENPFPDRALKAITFRSEGISVVGIVAMTVSNRVIYPKPFELEKKDTFPLPALSVVLADGPAGSGNMMLRLHLQDAKVGLRIGSFENLNDSTDVVVVCGRLTTKQCEALNRYVRSGGAALLVTQTPPQRELQEILPIDVARTSLYDCRDDTSFLVPVDETHPLFSGIPWDRPKEAYPIAPAYEYYKTTARPEAVVLASWNDKSPAIVYRQAGKGRVLAWTCTSTTPGGRQGQRSSHIDYLYAKMLFWLAGYEDVAARFGTLARAKDTRQALLDPLAELRIQYENVKAVAGYLGGTQLKQALARWRERLSAIDGPLAGGDDLIVAFEPEKALAAYKRIGDQIEVLQKELDSLSKKVAAAVESRADISRARLTPGRPLEIGYTHLDYRHPPFGHKTVETWNLRRQIVAIKQLGWTHFDTVPNVLVKEPIFLRAGADPEHPSPEHFDFCRFYDPLVQVCRETGVKAISNRACAYWNPAGGVGDYLTRGIERMITGEGEELTHWFGVQANYFSDEARKRIDALWQAHAMYVDRQPEIIAVELDNEMGLRAGYGPLAKRKWHQWLKARFRTVEDMNATFGTDYKTFRDVPPVRDRPQRRYGASSAMHAQWYEFHKFLNASHEHFFKLNFTAHDRYSNKPVIDRSGAYGTQGCRIMEMLARTHDYLGPHQDKKIHLDLTVGATKGPIWLNEYYFNYWAGPWAGFHYRLFGDWILPVVEVQNKNFAAFGRNLWFALSRGVTHISVYSHIGGGIKRDFDQGWFGPCAIWWHDITPNFDGMALKYVPEEYNRISGELAGSKARSQLCILEPFVSVMQSDSLRSSRGGTVINEMEHIRRVCYTKNIQADLPHQKYDFSGYPVVILPIAYYMEKELVDRLIRYVKQGGTLVATGAPNIYDEYSHPSMTLLKQTAAVKSAGRGDSGGYIKTSYGEMLTAPAGENACWKYTLAPSSEALALGTYADGSLAAFACQHGRGRIVVVGIEAGQAPDTFWKLVKSYVEQRIDRPFDNSNVRIELYHRVKGEDSLLFVMNQDHEKPQTTTITWRSPCAVVDLRAAVKVAATNSLELRLEPGECRVLKFVGYNKAGSQR